MKRLNALAVSLVLLAGIGGSLLIGQIKQPAKTPSSVLHVITVRWKADATDAQKQAAIDGVKKMASEIPGITNVWLKTVKVQPRDYSAVIAMEFRDKAAFDAYANHPSHKAWEKVYLPIRDESTTHDVTN